MRLRRLTLVMVAAALAACGRKEKRAESGGEISLPPDAALLGARGGPIGMTDRQVLAWLTESHRDEVEIAELARDRATDPELKELAAMLRTDHARLVREGGMLEKQLPDPSPADSVPASPIDSQAVMHTRTMNALRSTSGEAFDRLLAKELADIHERMLDTLKKWNGKALDPKLNTAMEKAAPIVERHLTDARRIDERFKKILKAQADSVKKVLKARQDSTARAARDSARAAKDSVSPRR